MARFISCSQTFDASKVVRIFLDEVVKLQGLPKTIVSDRDTRFTSYFLKILWHLLGTKLNFSIAYHPQTDGQTKVINRSLGNLLRCLIGENLGNWDLLLPRAEFAYNNSVNRSTSKALLRLSLVTNLEDLLTLFLCHLMHESLSLSNLLHSMLGTCIRKLAKRFN